jgi:RecA/RadA recombinase
MAKSKKDVEEDVETGGADLVKFLIGNSKSKFTSTVQKSKYFNKEFDLIDTKLPILNAALSGDLSCGFGRGVTMFAALPKRYKTLLTLYCVKAFLDKFKNGVCLFFDSEGGSSKKYFENVGVDTNRIVWTPVLTIDELIEETVSQIENIKKANDPENKVCIVIDSIGNLPSASEFTNALKGDIKTNMSRPKELKSFFRMITLQSKLLDLPIFVVNHIYKSQGGYISEDIIGGGEASQYASDSIYTINKRQIKDQEKSLEGFTFELVALRSRLVKEKSKFPLDVYFSQGIAPYSGLAILSTELGVVESIKISKSKGLKFGDIEILEKDNEFNSEFWEKVLNESNIKELVRKKYSLERIADNTDE